MTEHRDAHSRFQIDRLLARRGLRHGTLGPTGKRLFCDHLENFPGVCGRFCYLHDRSDQEAIEDPITLELTVNGRPLGTRRAAVYWYPSYLYRRTTQHGLRLQEYKFITDDDVVCDQIELTNEGDIQMTVELAFSSGALQETARVGRDGIATGWRSYGMPVRMVLAAPSRAGSDTRVLRSSVRISPGESTTLFVAAAFSNTQIAAQKALNDWAKLPDPLLAHRQAYQEWFDTHCPSFECSDRRVTRMWWYRWFVARHNLVEPDAGNIRHPLFYEGKHGGYARGITASAPLILNEVRWLRDPRFCHGMIRNYVETQPAHGLYRDIWVDRTRGLEPGLEGNPDPGYEEFLPAAFRGALMIHPKPGLMETVARSVARNIDGLRKLRDTNSNLLLNPGGHHMTQEHAPSFTHFHDYHDWYDYTELERPDYSSFFYASLCAAAALHHAANLRDDAAWFENMAVRCSEAICEHLWDEEDGFFYSIREADGEFARCREANGFFPFAFNAVPDDPTYHRAISYLLDEHELLTKWPFATASQRCPVFSARPGYWGGERKPSRAMWNGPTWPYTNSILVEALGNLLRHHTQKAVTAEILCAFIGNFARLMYEEGDTGSPMVREVYDGETGEGYGCPDYFHSSFNDLIVRFMCGVVPVDEREFVVDPLCEGWTHFRLENLPYHRHRVSIIYEARPGGKAYKDVEPGLTVMVDGRVVAHESRLEPIVVSLPRGEGPPRRPG